MNARALTTGVGVALALAFPAVLLVQVVDSVGDEGVPTGIEVLAGVVVLAGLVTGGWFAARAQGPDGAAMHGTAAGTACVAVLLVVGTARLLALGEDVAWPAMPVVLGLGALLGWTGAALGRRWAGRTRP